MQNENDDIDGLFRRAAEEYPLKTSGSNWEKVSQMLDKEKPSQSPLLIRFGNLSSFIALIIILIGLGFGVGYFMNQTKTKTINDKSIPAQNNIAQPSSKPIDNNASPSIVVTPSSNIKSTDASVKLPDTKQTFFNNQTITTPSIIRDNIKALSNSKTIANRKIVSTSNTRMLVSSPLQQSSTDDVSVYSNDQPSNISSTESFVNTEADLTKDNFLIIPLADTLAVLTNINKLNVLDIVTPKTIDQKLKAKESKFYTSLLAGPDFSNIKSQALYKTGYTIGFLVGIKVNRLSFESGALWDKKYYYSDGKYFNPKTNANSTRYGTITDLNGVCNMIELPVNMGYTLSKSSTPNSLLAKVGVSSYIMKKESYDYNYIYYGANYNGNATYKNSSKNFLAVLNLGVLYNYKINKKISLGVEPYYKVPLTSIGFGRMPISSTGIFAVLTKNF